MMNNISFLNLDYLFMEEWACILDSLFHETNFDGKVRNIFGVTYP